MDLADRVVVLKKGQIEQIGTTEALDAAPASSFVFDFLGDANRLPCRTEGRTASFAGFAAPVANTPSSDGPATAWFRPHETLLDVAGEGLDVTVADILTKGGIVRCECRTADGTLLEADYARGALPAGVTIGAAARLRPRSVFIFDAADA